MKCNAFICDYCKEIFDLDSCMGVNETVDLFDLNKSLPVISPNKATIHFCTDCYRKNVLIPASGINRAKDEVLYKNTIAEYTYSFKKGVIAKSRTTKK